MDKYILCVQLYLLSAFEAGLFPCVTNNFDLECELLWTAMNRMFDYLREFDGCSVTGLEVRGMN